MEVALSVPAKKENDDNVYGTDDGRHACRASRTAFGGDARSPDDARKTQRKSRFTPHWGYGGARAGEKEANISAFQPGWDNTKYIINT